MKTKKISLILCLLLIVLCFVGCKDAEGNNSDFSSNSGTTSNVPIVIVDDEGNSETTQSELDEILESWENNNPTINIEVDTSDEDDNSNSSNNSSQTDTNSSLGNSSDATASDGQENNSSNDSSDSSDSQEQESSDNSSDNSSNTDSSDTGDDKEDDGYFDVAV